ncbi:lymphocyte cytosolic protein 2a isoform X2 [Mugil cephalus]|uniref:lymphocyte cytosolic protein 2a isoform X2 n=1 Tax=Mugil cephalus TaxID=48193 RepID=UPI001FB5CFE5|nr:lymphocyte cytosolic protein 2a isoform X2 [Mugil cephalus]
MSSDRMPSKSEVMGWSPQQLADFLRRMNLSGCDKVVLKNSISGSRFVNLSDNDLQKFPKLHAPMISKISNEISKKEGKSLFQFGKKQTPYYAPDTGADVQGWGEDEFDEFDEDYESPYSGEDDGGSDDYESPNDDDDNRDNHVSSMAPPPVLCPRPPVAAPSTLSLPRDPASRRDPSPHSAGRPSAKFPSAPPAISRTTKPGRDPNAPMRGPRRDPGESGGQPWRSQQDFPPPPNMPKPPTLPPPGTSVTRSNSSARQLPRNDTWPEQAHDDAPKHNTFPLHNKSLPPRPGLPGPPSRHGDSLPSSASLPHKMSSAMMDDKRSDRQSFRPPPPTTGYAQELDPRWYVGKVTRGQAEGCLKRVCKDGAYLVRDSTRQLANQPFTLMVLYQDKVFNIQIRQQNQQFQLGTGLKAQESFPSVTDIICHYSHSPLLLIDAKNRGSGQQNQCLLSDPAGYYMSG